jgi:Rad3-related DNA helicase
MLDIFSGTYIENYVVNDSPYKRILVRADYYDEIEGEKIVERIQLSIIDIVDKLKEIKEYDFLKEANFLESLANFIKIFFDKNNNDKYIKIVSIENDQEIHSFTLLNPGKYLKSNLWNNLKSCVLTSATLSI